MLKRCLVRRTSPARRFGPGSKHAAMRGSVALLRQRPQPQPAILPCTSAGDHGEITDRATHTRAERINTPRSRHATATRQYFAKLKIALPSELAAAKLGRLLSSARLILKTTTTTTSRPTPCPTSSPASSPRRAPWPRPSLSLCVDSLFFHPACRAAFPARGVQRSPRLPLADCVRGRPDGLWWDDAYAHKRRPGCAQLITALVTCDRQDMPRELLQ